VLKNKNRYNALKKYGGGMKNYYPAQGVATTALRN
jgi:hypothetical protein